MKPRSPRRPARSKLSLDGNLVNATLASLGLSLCTLLAPGCSRAEPAPSQAASEPGARAGGVTHLRLEGELDVGNLSHLKRAIDAARAAGHDRLIVEIDTNGGAIDLMWKISKLLRDAASKDLVLVAWVHDHAASAGVMVALSCDKIYMTISACIGSAMPVTLGPLGVQALPAEDGTREKFTSEMRAEFEAMAQKQHRPGALAKAMVDANVEVRQVRIDGELKLVDGKDWEQMRASGNPPELVRTIVREGELLNLTGTQAVELGFADGTAESLADVMDKIGYANLAPQNVERRASDDAIAWLERFTWLLLIGGLVLAYTELKMPGFGLPGILSIACFALVLAGRYMAGLADIPHIVAVALGAALIAVEIFAFPGTLWLGIAGAVLVLGGLVLGSLGPGFDFDSALDKRLILDASFHLMTYALAATLGVLLLSRFLPKTPLLRRMVLDPGAGARSAAFAGAMPEASRGARVGEAGVALTALRPVGKVALDSDPAFEFEARAEGGLVERGVRVRVIEVSAGRLLVEAADASGEVAT